MHLFFFFFFFGNKYCPNYSQNKINIYLSICLGCFPQFGGGAADNTKETTKTMGVLLRSFSNDEGPGRVWMALLEQHSPSPPRLLQLQILQQTIRYLKTKAMKENFLETKAEKFTISVTRKRLNTRSEKHSRRWKSKNKTI